MVEFDYLKAGDRCWVWDAHTNETVEGQVLPSDLEGHFKVQLPNGGGYFYFKRDTGAANHTQFRLVHAPFKAEFPPRPKRMVKKEGWVRKSRIVGGDVLDVEDMVHVTWEEEE